MTNKHEAPTLPSAPAAWRKYVQEIVAVTGALGIAVAPLAGGTGNISTPEIVQAGIAFLTALGVIGTRKK